MPYFVKDLTQNTYGFYGSTEAIQATYPEISINTILYHTSRKKQPYITDKFEVYYAKEIIRSEQK